MIYTLTLRNKWFTVYISISISLITLLLLKFSFTSNSNEPTQVYSFQKILHIYKCLCVLTVRHIKNGGKRFSCCQGATQKKRIKHNKRCLQLVYLGIPHSSTIFRNPFGCPPAHWHLLPFLMLLLPLLLLLLLLAPATEAFVCLCVFACHCLWVCEFVSVCLWAATILEGKFMQSRKSKNCEQPREHNVMGMGGEG